MSWAPKNIPLTPSLVRPVLKSSKQEPVDDPKSKIFDESFKPHKSEAPLTLPVLPSKIRSSSIKFREVKTQSRSQRQEMICNQPEDLIMNDCPMLVYWAKKVDQEKIESLAEKVKECTSKMETSYKSCFQAYGKVSEKDWKKALEIYENNQDFFYQKFIQNKIKEEKYSFHLNQLEMWFCGISEPKRFVNKRLKQMFEDGNRDERERFKIMNGRSFFCRKEIIPVILPFPEELRNFIADFCN